MSKVSESASNDLLNKLSLVWVDGNTLHEIIPPDNAPVILPFGMMHKFSNEANATQPFADYLNKSFAASGVVMGKGGLEVKCVYLRKGNLKLETDTDCFSGYLDIVVLPFGSRCFESQMRLGVELKQNKDDKKRYKDDNPPSCSSSDRGPSTFRKRQADAPDDNEEEQQVDDDEGVDSKFR